MAKKKEGWELFNAVLTWDLNATSKLVKFVDSHYGPLNSYNTIFTGLEISCHGIPWLIGTTTLMFLINFPVIRRLSVNLFLALLIDIVVVVVVKAFIQRGRPPGNKKDMFTSYATDKYSFPSGHAARATMLAFLLLHEFSFIFPLRVLLLAWSSAVSASRLFMKRHYLLDIIGGMVIGWLNAFFISRYIWLPSDSADALVDFFLDESRVGASYDV